jgi:hypothetical protein
MAMACSRPVRIENGGHPDPKISAGFFESQQASGAEFIFAVDVFPEYEYTRLLTCGLEVALK